MSSSPPAYLSAFRPVPRTGVIYVTTEAERRGYRFGDPAWANLGQGQPETTALGGAPPRIDAVRLSGTEDYAPVAGMRELREAVAGLYNELYRRGRSSKYTSDNVAICGGGRVALMRACAAIGSVHMGHFLPDYTAYAELLDVFRRFTPIPLLLDPANGYDFPASEFRREILGLGLGAVLASNPCNPTGKVVRGSVLEGWVTTARELECALILDEFYSHYIWAGDAPFVSAAEFVDDVDRDAVVLLDGLTKNWRYPGWRVAWIVGPRSLIEAASSAGSFIDGGGSHPMQRAAVDLITVAATRAETEAIRRTFLPKRRRIVDGLRELGVRFDVEPEGTFYAWGDLSALPESIRDGENFFSRALDHRVVVVPGEFFDVDPGQRRRVRPSRFSRYVRFSFGPAMDAIDAALVRLAEMIRCAH